MIANEDKKERAPEWDPTCLINANTYVLARPFSPLVEKEPCSSAYLSQSFATTTP